MAKGKSKRMRDQVWKAMLQARLSAIYYELTIASQKRWCLLGRTMLALIVIVGAYLAVRWPSQVWSVVGNSLATFFATLSGFIAYSNRVQESRGFYREWNGQYYEAKAIWDRIEADWPKISSSADQTIRLLEHERSITDREFGSPNRKRSSLAYDRLLEEMGLQEKSPSITEAEQAKAAPATST